MSDKRGGGITADDGVDKAYVCYTSPVVSGSYPLQLQGRPTCPRGQSARTEEGIEGQVDLAPSRSEGSQDKARV